MPAYGITPYECTAVEVVAHGDSVPSVVIRREGIHVRRPAVADPHRFDRTARLLSYGYFTTPPRAMSGLTGVFGLSVHAAFQDGVFADSVVGVQVSLNSGTSYLYYNGAAWVPQLLTENYNTIEQFNDACASLALVHPKVLSFRFRLSTTQGNPTFHSAAVFTQYDYDHTIDLYTTLKQKVEAARFPITQVHPVPTGGTSTIPLAGNRYLVDTTAAATVYNLTTDPNRNTNIFRDFNAGTIRLTAAQAAGQLEFTVSGYAPVQVIRRDEMVNTTELPITVVKVQSDLRNGRGATSGYMEEYKSGTTNKLYRRRQAPHLYDVAICVEHWSPNVRATVAACDAIQAEFAKPFASLATGDEIRVLETYAARVQDFPLDSFNSGTWECRLRFRRHFELYTEGSQARMLKFALGTFNKLWKQDDFDVEEP